MIEGQIIFQVLEPIPQTGPNGEPMMRAVAGSPNLGGAFHAVEQLKLKRYAITCMVVLKSTVDQLDSGLIIPKLKSTTPTNGDA